MKTDRLRLLLVVVCVLGTGIAVGNVRVPRIIERAYHQMRWSLRNQIVQGPQLKMTEAALVATIALVVVTLVRSKPRFFQENAAEATPAALGAIRMLTCASLLIVTLIDDPAHVAVLPPEIRLSMGLVDGLYHLPIGFVALVTSGPGLRTLETFTVLILFLGMIGWRTRVVIPLGALCYLLLGGIDRQYSHLYHAGLVPLYVMTVLSWTPCGDGWSVDHRWRLRARLAPKPERSSRTYGWSRYACWVAIALPYAAAGFSKLRNGGLLWWNATNMRGFLYQDTLQPERFNWRVSLHLTQAPDFIFALLGVTTMVVELMFVLVLFSRLARRILPILAIIMHIGIFFLQNVWFFDLILMQFAFFDVDRLPTAVGKWLAPGHSRIRAVLSEDERESTAARATNGTPRALPYAVAVSGLAITLLLASVYRVEFYPLTAWELYSGSDTSGRIEYYKALAHREAGTTTPASFEELGRTRSKDLIRMCFGTRQSIHFCEDVFRALGSAYNAEARPGQRLRQFEFQRWLWDFRSHPADPAYGALVDRIVVPISR